jgi:glycosyltransferase involved in cell wall biosynthesis
MSEPDASQLDHPTVSVVIPAFNAESTLGRALDSIALQSCPAIEVIVVDDCSTDATPRIAADYTALPVRVLRQPGNRGAAAARNAGLACCRGEFVAFLDADDEWLEGKLARQLEMFGTDPEIGLVGSRYRQVFDDGRRPRIQPDGDLIEEDRAWYSLMARACLQTSTVIIRRAILEREGTAFDESLRVGEDQDLWIRLALRTRVAFVDACLVNKYEYGTSLSAREPLANARYMLPVVERHLRENRGRISPAERRYIQAARLSKAGRDACYNGHYLSGLPLVLRAVLMGHRPVYHLLFLARIGLRVPITARSRLRAEKATRKPASPPPEARIY